MNPARVSSLLFRPRIVRGRRNLFAAAGALLCGLSGCTLPDDTEPVEPVDPPVMSEGRQVRTTFQIRASEFSEPTGVFLMLDEAPNAGGLFEGTLTLNTSGRALSAPIAALLEGESELSVAAGAVGGIEWDDLRIDVRDADGDGVYESGSGHIEAKHVWFPGGEVFAHDFEAAPDAFRALATARPDGAPGRLLLPWQPLLIELGQPVSEEDVTSYEVLANGSRVGGVTQLLESDPYHYTSMRFVPEAFYPPGAELTVVTTNMRNVLGAPVESDPTPIPVLSDPGPINDNLGFEQGLAGWSVVGSATTEASFGDVVPGEGAAMAVLHTALVDFESYQSRLLGYLDVPADASELDLSLELLTEDRLPAAATVRLYRDDAHFSADVFEIYEFGHEAEGLVPCDCADVSLTMSTGPFRRQINLAPFRGERVFIEFLLDGSERQASVASLRALGVRPIPPPLPPVPAALVVDDIQIR